YALNAIDCYITYTKDSLCSLTTFTSLSLTRASTCSKQTSLYHPTFYDSSHNIISSTSFSGKSCNKSSIVFPEVGIISSLAISFNGTKTNARSFILGCGNINSSNSDIHDYTKGYLNLLYVVHFQLYVPDSSPFQSFDTLQVTQDFLMMFQFLSPYSKMHLDFYIQLVAFHKSKKYCIYV